MTSKCLTQRNDDAFCISMNWMMSSMPTKLTNGM